jgi:transglutaminase-like putative cysteine protease
MRGWFGAALAGAVLTVAAGSAAQSTEDSWFRLSVGGAHVGHAHRTVEVSGDGAVVTRVTSAMEVRRLGEVVRLTSVEEWTESSDGQPVSYHLTRDLGAEETRLTVLAGDGFLALEKLTASGSFRDTIDLEGRLLFPEGQRRLHVARGFVPGDRYSYVVFDPDFEDVSRQDVLVVGPDTLPAAPEDRTLRAGSDPDAPGRQTHRPGGHRAAPESTSFHKLSSTSGLYEGIEFLTWLDGRGLVWREEVPLLDLVSERTTREAAAGRAAVVDIIAEAMIETNVRIEDPRSVDEALYEIWIDGGDVSAFIPEDGRQLIEGETDRGVLLRVRRLVPIAGAANGGSAPQSGMDDYLESNALLQAEDPRIRGAAAEALGGERPGPWPSATRIERYVFDTVETVGFGSAFASALEVLQDRTGDCSEYAVLAAAMCRAVGIPSRVVSGLVHVRGRFAYHMWIEVWVGGDWYALDPSVGEGSVDATHIKLAESSLAGGAVGELSLAIMRVMNRLGMNVVEYSDEQGAVEPDAAR